MPRHSHDCGALKPSGCKPDCACWCHDESRAKKKISKQEFLNKIKNEGIRKPQSFTLEQVKKLAIVFNEGEIINIEGELFLITKTRIGNSHQLRINLKMIKNMEEYYGD
jgi:uncharacterized protein (DUF2267 family)